MGSCPFSRRRRQFPFFSVFSSLFRHLLKLFSPNSRSPSLEMSPKANCITTCRALIDPIQPIRLHQVASQRCVTGSFSTQLNSSISTNKTNLTTMRIPEVPLRTLFIPRQQNVNFFSAVYSPANTYHNLARRYLRQPLHPLLPKIEHMYSTREQGILWWCVAHGHLNSERRTVRSISARRLRKGVIEALRRRGYDPKGRRLDILGPEEQPLRWRVKAPLSGTLEFFMKTPIIKGMRDWEELVRQTGAVIDAVANARNR